MKQTISYKNIWRVALPIIFSIVSENIVNVTDTAFLARVGIVELGAAGNAGILFLVLLEVGLGYSIGSEIIIGRRNGEKNYHQIGSIFHTGIFFMLPMAFLLFLLVQFVSPVLLGQFTASPEILEASNVYLEYRSFGIFFAFLNFLFISFYTGITSTKVLAQTTFLQAIVNVIFDYLLIFGHFGFPEMGIKGAAIACVIAEFVALSYFIIYTFYKVDLNLYLLFQKVQFNLSQLGKILKVSFPIMLQYFMALSAWLAFFMIIEQIGEKELAVSHIVRSIYMVLMIPLFGFSSATSTLVSNLIGEGKHQQVRLLVKRIVVLCLGSTILFAPIILGFPNEVISIYTDKVELIQAVKPILWVISASMLFFCVAFVHFSAVTGTGKTLTALGIELISILIYLIGAYLLGIHFQLPLKLVWCSEFIYFTIMGTLAILYLRFGNWRSSTI